MKDIWNKINGIFGEYIDIKKLLMVVLIVGTPIAVWNVFYPWGSIKYKVTVIIETPEGTKTGSAVRKYTIISGPKHISTSNTSTWLSGEAVVVDLGERGVVFAVMGTDDYRILYKSFPFKGASSPSGIRYYNGLKNAKTSLNVQDRPLLVTFTDIKDPKTVTPVYRIYSDDPYSRNLKDLKVEDRFEEVFGKGVFLKDITIETTNEPVTWKIEEYLGWWKYNKGGYLDGQFSGGGPELSNILHGGNFKVGE